MEGKDTRGETHGCIVCGKPYHLYVVYDGSGKFIDFKVMSAGGKPVKGEARPLVACEKHDDDQVKAAVAKVYGPAKED
ncbi:MAG: hypothetical protein JNM55_07625 [Anaerolineales bacterium]|nr:hypothetical protein [Anaerolineales bacterium]